MQVTRLEDFISQNNIVRFMDVCADKVVLIALFPNSKLQKSRSTRIASRRARSVLSKKEKSTKILYFI
jgi:hypothetical protein